LREASIESCALEFPQARRFHITEQLAQRPSVDLTKWVAEAILDYLTCKSALSPRMVTVLPREGLMSPLIGGVFLSTCRLIAVLLTPLAGGTVPQDPSPNPYHWRLDGDVIWSLLHAL
jgi:hypothetical protein